MMEEKAMEFLATQIAKKSGDIRVVFDVMKAALTKLFKQINAIPDSDFSEVAKFLNTLQITKTLMISVFDDKKGIKIKDTLKNLPRQDIQILDAICDLFYEAGEEK